MGYMCLFQFWFPQGISLGVGLPGHMVVLVLVLKIWNAWWICVPSLCRGRANLCIVPILEYVLPKWVPPRSFLKTHKVSIWFPWTWLTSFQLLVPHVFFPSYGVTPSPVSNNVLLILQDQVQMVSLPGSCSGLLFILSLLWSSVSPPCTFLMHIILCLVFFVYLLLLLSHFSSVRLCATP